MDTRTGRIYTQEEVSAMPTKEVDEFFRRMKDGPTPIQTITKQVRGSDPCPCGSGYNFKRCCLLAKAIAQLVLLVVLLLFASPTSAAGPLGTLVEATDFRVIDGDTIDCHIKLPFDVTLTDKTVRAERYDAWESNKRRRTVGEITDAEVAKGKAATEALREFLRDKRLYLGPQLDPPNPGGGGGMTAQFGSDVYGRVMAELWAWDGYKWTDISEWMGEHGHTRPKFRRVERPMQIIIVSPSLDD